MQRLRMQRPDGRGCLITFAVLIAVAGCGYRRPPLARVEAVVTLDSEPVAEADVTLVPVGPGRAARGLTDEAGKVVFSTYGSNDGVIPGTYKAIVAKRELTKRGARKMAAVRSSPSPSEETTAEVMVELTDGDYRNLLPDRYAGFDITDLSVTIERSTRRITLVLTSTASEAGR